MDGRQRRSRDLRRPSCRRSRRRRDPRGRGSRGPAPPGAPRPPSRRCRRRWPSDAPAGRGAGRPQPCPRSCGTRRTSRAPGRAGSRLRTSAARYPLVRSSVATNPGIPLMRPIRRWPSPSRCSVASIAPAMFAAATSGNWPSSGYPSSATTNGKPLLLQVQEVVGRLVGEHEDRAVDLPLEQLVDEGELPLLMVERRTQDGLHVELVERLGEARDQLGEVVAEHHRDRHADQPGPAGRRRPERPIRGEVELADDLEHRLAGLRRDVGPVVEHARDRRDRHARVAGDVADRRASGFGRPRRLEAPMASTPRCITFPV